MKRIIYTLIILLILVSCQQEDLVQPQSPGFLSLDNVTVATSDVNSIQTKAGIDARFVIEIWKEGALYNNCKYEPGSNSRV